MSILKIFKGNDDWNWRHNFGFPHLTTTPWIFRPRRLNFNYYGPPAPLFFRRPRPVYETNYFASPWNVPTGYGSPPGVTTVLHANINVNDFNQHIDTAPKDPETLNIDEANNSYDNTSDEEFNNNNNNNDNDNVDDLN